MKKYSLLLPKLSLLLTIMIIAGLTGCSAPVSQRSEETVPTIANAPTGNTGPTEGSASGDSDSETRIVTDVWNRDVEIPAKVNSIICLGSMAPRMAAYLDVVDMMTGAEDSDIESESIRYDYSPVYHDVLSKLPTVGSGGGSGENNGYPEEIITLAPDVILAGFNEDAAEELQRQTGIPVVSIRYRTQGFIDDGFHRSLRIFAETVGAQERCEEVLSYIDSCKKDLSDRTSDYPVEDKQKAYTGAVTFNGRHGFSFTYVNFPAFDAVNALNVADELLESQTKEAADAARETGKAYIGNDGFEVDLEQILAWDPDIIFLDPGNMDLVSEEYEKNPDFFKSLRAIREGNVYTMPSTNAAGPNITYLLINAYHAGKILYPEAFEDIDLSAKAEEIMNTMLGKNFFKEMEDGGLYYGKIEMN